MKFNWAKQKQLYPENWQSISREVRKSNRCEECGSTSKLQVHHKIPITAANSSFANDRSNLACLCFDCHANKHRHLTRRR